VNIGPFPAWGDRKKIVAMDPWGHVAPWAFSDSMAGDNGAVPFSDPNLAPDTDEIDPFIQWTFALPLQLPKLI
jgi:hypothetical protein